jgi:hypothetical protein
MHGLRNRVSAIIFVARREISEETRFLEIYAQAKFLEIYARAKKPGFCDYLCSATRDIGRNPVSGDLCTGQETGFLEIYAQAKFLEMIFIALKTIILKPHHITNLIFFANKTTLWYTTRL